MVHCLHQVTLAKKKKKKRISEKKAAEQTAGLLDQTSGPALYVQRAGFLKSSKLQTVMQQTCVQFELVYIFYLYLFPFHFFIWYFFSSSMKSIDGKHIPIN